MKHHGITIYIPEGMQFDEIKLKTGVNETNIEYLEADKLIIEMGLGKYNIDELIARYAKIKAGAGEASITKSKIGELKLEGGIGKLSLASKITNEASIHCGIGKVKLDLIGVEADYKIKADTGLGSFNVDNKSVSDGQTIGNGLVTVKVESGIGETTVNYIEETMIED